PSKIGWSHGPKIASRWSHVQTESQPLASAARAESRNSGHVVCWDQSWAPNRIRSLLWGPPAGDRPDSRRSTGILRPGSANPGRSPLVEPEPAQLPKADPLVHAAPGR